MKSTILSFLTQLQENNNREWFQANKAMYEAAKDDFETFINSLIPAIARFDESIKFITAKECIFRIFRDVRFAKDKSPYKTNFGAFMARGGTQRATLSNDTDSKRSRKVVIAMAPRRRLLCRERLTIQASPQAKAVVVLNS